MRSWSPPTRKLASIDREGAAGQPVSAEAAALPKPLTWLRRVAAVFPLAELLPLRMPWRGLARPHR